MRHLPRWHCGVLRTGAEPLGELVKQRRIYIRLYKWAMYLKFHWPGLDPKDMLADHDAKECLMKISRQASAADMQFGPTVATACAGPIDPDRGGTDFTRPQRSSVRAVTRDGMGEPAGRRQVDKGDRTMR